MDSRKTVPICNTALEPQRVGPNELLRSLPTWAFLWFHDLSKKIWITIWRLTVKIEPAGQAHPSGGVIEQVIWSNILDLTYYFVLQNIQCNQQDDFTKSCIT